MSHQEIVETFLRMGAITRRFLDAVNYRGNPAIPLFPRYPQSSSTSTSRSHAAPSSSSRSPFQAALYPVRPPTHPPFRMSPLGGLLSEVLRLHITRTTRTCTCTNTGSFLALAAAFHPGIDHYSIILDCIN
jgi:hypothetical protein